MDTGWLSPTRYALYSGPGDAWISPANILADDGVYAQIPGNSPNYNSQKLVTFYDPAIPANSIIVGVEYRIKYYNTGASDLYMGLSSDGGANMIGGGSPFSDTINSQTVTTFTYGSASSNPDNITPAIANSSSFCVFTYIDPYSGQPLFADVISIRITYLIGTLSPILTPTSTVTSSSTPFVPGPYETPVNAWSTPENAQTSNNLYATQIPSALSGNNDYLFATGFNFNIPEGNIISGIQLKIERAASGGSTGNMNDDVVSLIKNNTLIGANRAINSGWGTSTSDPIVSYGSFTDNWGLTNLKPSDLNDPTFGVAFRARQPGGTSGTSSFSSPTTFGTTTGSGGLTWQTPGDAASSNNVRTTLTAPGVNANAPEVYPYLQVSGFNFSVTAGRVISAIEVGVERSRSGGTIGEIRTDTIQLTYNGNPIGFPKSSTNNWPTTEAYETFGNTTTDTWGVNLTAEQAASGLGVLIRPVGSTADTNRIAQVDYVRMRITTQTVGNRTARVDSFTLQVFYTDDPSFKKFATIINQLVNHTAISQRKRGHATLITETEDIFADLTVVRAFKKFAAVINESLQHSAIVKRNRKLVALLQEVITHTAAAARTRKVSTIINELETIQGVLARKRSNSTVIQETETINSLLKRARSFAVAIEEAETISGLLSKVKRLSASIEETISIYANSLRKRGLSSEINEQSSITSNVTRRRGMQAQIEELSDTIALLTRNRLFAALVAENEDFAATLQRARKMVTTIAEQLFMSAVTSRKRGMSLSINEFETISLQVISALKYLSAAIEEAEFVSAAFKRDRGVLAQVAEVEDVAVSIKRLRKLFATVEEEEEIDTSMSRHRAILAYVGEIEGFFSNLNRQRGVDATIGELESFTGSINRARTTSAIVNELETLVGAISRARHLGTIIQEEENISFSLSRFRGVVSEIIETQGLNAGRLRRIRGIIADISESLNISVSLKITSTEPGTLQLTATWQEWVKLDDCTMDLQDRTATWTLTRRSKNVEFELKVGEEVVIELNTDVTCS